MENEDDGVRAASAVGDLMGAKIAAHRQFFYLLVRQLALNVPEFDVESFLESAYEWQTHHPTPSDAAQVPQQRLERFGLDEFGRLIGEAERALASARHQIDSGQDG